MTIQRSDLPHLQQPEVYVSRLETRLPEQFGRWSVLGLFVLAVAVYACTKSPPKRVSSDTGTADTAHQPFSLDLLCNRLKWRTCPVWVTTDDQQLNDGLDNYGPVAFVAPSPILDSLHVAEDFNFQAAAKSGFAVAAVQIGEGNVSGPLPTSYTNLQLSWGLNCVYLNYDAVGGWKAMLIKEPTGDPVPCPRTRAMVPNLKVIRVVHSHFNNDADVPAVARFHEGRDLTNVLKAQPLIGVKCGNGWCIIAPPNGDTVPFPRPPGGAAQRSWAVYGWNDAQHLALKDPATNKLVYGTNMLASIAVNPFLGTMKMDGAMQRAAAVFFVGNPEGTKYATKWGFKKGLNMILLQKKGPGSWIAQTAPPGNSPPHDLHVDWHQHTFLPPATARFRWDSTDEGLWVRCDAGCCRVSGG
jgi:hypothetical protein